MTLRVGHPAPGFKLMSHLGKEISLENLRGKNIVLAFFPQAYTPI